jgi:hypothetical protein
MKKIILFLSAVLLIATSCKKDKSEEVATFDEKAVVMEVFTASMTGYSQAQMLKSSVPVNKWTETYVYGPEGGYIHVSGSVTGSININDQTGAILGGTLLLDFNETLNGYAFKQNSQTYTMNGAPYVSLAGTFTLLPGGTTFGTASSMEIGGGVRVTGPNYDQTINFNVTIIINSNGSGGHVSGTIGGVSVDYTF